VSPAQAGWSDAPLAVTGLIDDAGCDQEPLLLSNVMGLSFTLFDEGGGLWSFTSQSLTSGRYTGLEVTAISGCGQNLDDTQALGLDFGVDQVEPLVLFSGIPTMGVDPMNPNTWPAVAPTTPIALAGLVRDLDSGLVEVEVALEVVSTNDTQTLFTQTIAPSGSPASGSAQVLLGMCSHQTLCQGNALNVGALEFGDYRLSILGQDSAGNLLVASYPFRKATLAQLLTTWKQANAALTSENMQAQSALDNVDVLLLQAEQALAQGQTGNLLLALEDAVSKTTEARAFDMALPNTITLYAAPLTRTLHAQLVTTLTTRQNERQDREGEYDAAQAALDEAQTNLGAGAVGDAVLNLAVAWFYIEDGYTPMFAEDYAETLTLIELIVDQMEDYVDHDPALIGRAQVQQGLDALGQVRDFIAEIVQTSNDEVLSDLEHVRLLLGLTNTAEALKASENNGVWVRNWQWGLTQIVYIYAARGIRNAGSFAGANNPVVLAGNAQLSAADEHRQQREADDFMQLLIDSRCLVLGIYNLAYEPDETVPSVCCDDIEGYHMLEPLVPVVCPVWLR
jgi:hypothetical protein